MHSSLQQRAAEAHDFASLNVPDMQLSITVPSCQTTSISIPVECGNLWLFTADTKTLDADCVRGRSVESHGTTEPFAAVPAKPASLSSGHHVKDDDRPIQATHCSTLPFDDRC